MPLITPSAGSKQVASVHVDIGANTTGFEKGAASVTGGIAKLGLSVGTIASALALLKDAWDFSKEGAKLQRLADAGAEVARQYGGNMDEIVRKIKEASLGTVSEMDIIASANRAMMLGLSADSDKLANLMEVAAFRGRAMGLDTTKAFNDIVTGLGRASPLILDNLGIIVNAKETYKNYAESIGKSASELSKAEKTQALLNAVLEEGNRMLEESGGLALDNAGKVEKLNATWKNFTDNRKRENADFAGNVSEMSANAIAGWDEYFKYLDAQGQIRDIAKEMTGGSVELITPEIFEQARQQWAEQQQSISDVNTELERNALLAEIAAQELEEASKANGDFIDAAIKLTDANEDYEEKQRKVLDAIAETRVEGEKLYPWEHEKIEENKKALEELGEQYLKNKDDFVAASLEKLAMMAIEKIALEDGVEGYSQAEYEKAQAILQTTDVATAAAFEQATAQQVLIDGLIAAGVEGEEFGRILQEVGADGVISMDEVAAALERIPTEKNVTINVATAYSGADLDAIAGMMSQSGRGTNRNNNSRASGGSVLAGETYLVGERGMELFTPNQSGYITPNNQLGNMGGDPKTYALLESIAGNKIDERRLARSIVTAMQQAGA